MNDEDRKKLITELKNQGYSRREITIKLGVRAGDKVDKDGYLKVD